MKNYPGVFAISLDFELHWGCFESMELNEYQQQYFKNTRAVIPEKLKLFSENEVHVTWATVGMLFNKNVAEWEQNKPAVIPTFDNPNVSAYEWINKHGFYAEDDPFHFAPTIIEQIKQTPYQEIGTHTYAHYFCLEPGQSKEQFRADLRKACDIATKNGIEIRSLVFPRNQFNKEYLSVCTEVGITSIRSSPEIWYWSPATGSSFMKKFFRAGDAYIRFQPIKPVFLKDIKIQNGLPLHLPATRLYRPWKPSYTVQNHFKISRILNEMTVAAKRKAYYHLWWHPHNFGNHPAQCMRELQQIIQHYVFLRDKYDFQSLTMNEITTLVNS